MTVTSRQRVKANLPLRQAPETRIGLSLATPLSMRVDQLVRALGRDGFHTSRKELISAALLGLPEDVDELSALIGKYRTETVGHALLPRAQSASVTLTREGPGPRRRV